MATNDPSLVHQEKMQQLFDFFVNLEQAQSQGEWEQYLSSLVTYLKNCTPDERAYLCESPFDEYPLTPLMAIVQMTPNVGFSPLTELLKGLDAQQRKKAYQFTSSEGKSAVSLVFTEFGFVTIFEEIMAVLFEGMADADIMASLQNEICERGMTIRLDAYLALLGKFSQEPLKSLALRQNINVPSLRESAYDTALIDDFQLGFITHFWTKQSNPSDFSIVARKRLFLTNHRYLYLALLADGYYLNANHDFIGDPELWFAGLNQEEKREAFGYYSNASHDFIDNLELWLEGFSQEEKCEALNPIALGPRDNNPIMEMAYRYKRRDLIDYLLTLGIPYSRRLQAIERDNLNIESQPSSTVAVANAAKNKLLETLNTYAFDAAELEDLTQVLEESDCHQLNEVIAELLKENLLNKNSLKSVLQRINIKIASPQASAVKKSNRHDTHQERSELRFDNDVSLFPDPEKGKRLSGGIGTVKAARGSNDKTYAIKREIKLAELKGLNPLNIFNVMLADSKHFIREAQNEVVCTRLTGRDAFWYMKATKTGHVKARAAIEWVEGTPLARVSTEKLKQTPYHIRVAWIASGLSDLNILHENHLIYGDLHDNNLIVNFANNTMKIIDFGSVHKLGQRAHAKNPDYTEAGRKRSDDMLHDSYIMGLISAQIFPELFRVSFEMPRVIQIKVANLTVIERAIVKLATAFMNPDIQARCTSEAALTYCNELMQYENLDQVALERIASTTIESPQSTVEKVLRSYTPRF